MRRVIIGDVHGCYDELRAILDKIGPSKSDMIVSIGDMIDYGPKSADVVHFFMRSNNTFAILGNHERKHVRFDQGLIAKRHFGKAQLETIRQFKHRFDELHLSYKETLEYFKTLPLYLNFPEALVVHAGMLYGIPLEEQDEKILTGAGFKRENQAIANGLFYWCTLYPPDAKPVIFGHLGIGKAPWDLPVRKNLWPLDAGCVSGGYLTAVVLPEFKIYQVKSLGSHRKCHHYVI